MAMRAARYVVVVAMLSGMAMPASAEPPPNFDWRQIEDLISGPNEHDVGEELCALPTARA